MWIQHQEVFRRICLTGSKDSFAGSIEITSHHDWTSLMLEVKKYLVEQTLKVVTRPGVKDLAGNIKQLVDNQPNLNAADPLFRPCKAGWFVSHLHQYILNSSQTWNVEIFL